MAESKLDRYKRYFLNSQTIDHQKKYLKTWISEVPNHDEESLAYLFNMIFEH